MCHLSVTVLTIPKAEYDRLLATIAAQEKIIAAQSKRIEQQDQIIAAQACRIDEQDKIIALLMKKVEELEAKIR